MNHEALASKAADAVGVTPHSDMRLYVEQAVKWALNEAALSAAEPVGWFNRPNDVHGYQQVAKEYEGKLGTVPLYAAPPAPSVAVKQLKWDEDGDNLKARMGDREWMLNITSDGKTWAGSTRPFVFGRNLTWSSVPNCSMVSLEEAKAACQADFQSRYVALSAQVQDVAGWQSMDSAPKDGKHCLLAVKSGPFVYAVQGAYSMGEWGNAADIHSEPLCWMPLTRIPRVYLPWTDEFASAAAAKQEG